MTSTPLIRTKQSIFILFGYGLSNFGNFLNFVTLDLIIFAKTQSIVFTGAFKFLRLLGNGLSGLGAGIVCDRFSKYRTLFVAEILQCAVILGFYFLIDTANTNLFFFLSFLLGLLNPLSNVSFLSSIPSLVSPEKLNEYNRKFSAVSSISMICGMAAGGALFSLVGFKNILLLDAMSFLAFASILVLVFGPSLSHGSNDSKKETFNLAKEWRFIKNRILKSPLLQYLYSTRMADAFGSASHLLGIPIIASLVAPGEASFWMSLIWGIWALGQITGVIAMKRFGKDQIKYFVHSYFVGTFGMSIFFIFLFLGFPHAIAFVGSFGAGFFDGVSEISFNNLLHKQVNEIQGRLFGLVNFFVRIGFALGMVLVTLVMEKMGTVNTVVLFHSIVCLLYILMYLKKKPAIK